MLYATFITLHIIETEDSSTAVTQWAKLIVAMCFVYILYRNIIFLKIKIKSFSKMVNVIEPLSLEYNSSFTVVLIMAIIVKDWRIFNRNALISQELRFHAK